MRRKISLVFDYPFLVSYIEFIGDSIHTLDNKKYLFSNDYMELHIFNRTQVTGLYRD